MAGRPARGLLTPGLTLLALSGALLGAAPAHGEGWTAATRLAGAAAPGQFTEPNATMTPGGTALGSWFQSGAAPIGYGVALRQPGATFGPAALPTSPDAEDLSFTAGPNGTTFASWQDDDNGDAVVRVAARAPGGGWTAPSTFPGSDPAVAVGAGGFAFVASTIVEENASGDDVNSIDVRAFGADAQPFGGAQRVVSAVNRDVSAPRIGAEADGDVTVAWGQQIGAGAYQIRVSRRAAATGAFDVVPVTAAATTDAPEPAMAVTPGGDVVIAYLAGTDGDELRVAGRTAGAPFVDLPTAGSEVREVFATAAGPGALVSWSRSTPSGSSVEVLPWADNTGRQPVETVTQSATADLATAPPAALGNGAAAIVWSRYEANTSAESDDATSVESRIRRADGSSSAVLPVAATGPGTFGAIDVQGDDAGNAFAVWSRLDPGADTDGDGSLAGDADDLGITEAAGLDAAAPLVTGFELPAGGRPGQALAFAASVVDVWSDPGVSWDFGDNTPPVQQAAPTHAFAVEGRFKVTATIVDGLGNATTRSGTVVIDKGAVTPRPTPAASATPAPSAPVDRVAPQLSGVATSAACVRPGAVAGLRLRFTSSEAATVRYGLLKRRESRGRARCPVRTGGRTPGTTTTVAEGVLAAPAGLTDVPVAGTAHRRRTRTQLSEARRGRNKVRLHQLLRDRRLRPGTYVVTLRATDAAGNTTDARVKFWVLRAARQATARP